MTTQPAWRRYERFHDDNVDADLDDEFSAHLALLVDKHLAAGMSPAAAESAARAAFANAGRAMAECRKLSVERLARDRRRAQIMKLDTDARRVVQALLARPLHTLVLVGGVAVVVAASLIFSAFLRGRV
ncbi:MAG TPA: permease prefix domain 1-containing protein [Gemmatimonadaceae bacterium]